MRICVPAADRKGLEGLVCAHFGSAPYYVVHDTERGTTEVLENESAHHAHSGCRPLLGLVEQEIGALVVCGIGRLAVARLNADGTKVYRAIDGTVAANLAALNAGELATFAVDAACIGHEGAGS